MQKLQYFMFEPETIKTETDLIFDFSHFLKQKREVGAAFLYLTGQQIEYFGCLD